MGKNRYQLDESVRKKYIPIIREHIHKIANCNLEDASRFEISLDLSDTELNPYILGMILVHDFGYEEKDMDRNGWQMDFWIYYTKEGMPELCIEGCGITFELTLRGNEEDEKEYHDLKNDKDFEDLIKKGLQIVAKAEAML